MVEAEQRVQAIRTVVLNFFRTQKPVNVTDFDVIIETLCTDMYTLYGYPADDDAISEGDFQYILDEYQEDVANVMNVLYEQGILRYDDHDGFYNLI